MEKRLNKKLEVYLTTFKDEIRDKATQLGLTKNEDINKLIMLFLVLTENFSKLFSECSSNNNALTLLLLK